MNIFYAFLFTLTAGLCTGIGSCIAFFTRHTNRKFLSVSLGFSGGVMIYVSMTEIFSKARDTLSAELGNRSGSWLTVAAFFGGMLLISVIDKLVPSEENLPGSGLPGEEAGCRNARLMRMGIFTALAIAIHNFPEGLATFVPALQDPQIAFPIVAAIAIHNIPEGIAVSVPVYQATGSKRQAFLYSFLSGLAEPAGALLGWLILMPFMGNMVFGLLFAVVGGIMVFISFDELLPTAREYGRHRLSIFGLVSGMAVMAVSLLLFL